jgi:hypothetical protein
VSERDRHLSRRVASFLVFGDEIERSTDGEHAHHQELHERLEARIGQVPMDEVIAGIVVRRGETHTVELVPEPRRDEARIAELIRAAFPDLDLHGLPQEWKFE